MRFDFHWTTEGWRISEANTDVPGGFNEATGFSSLMAAHYPDAGLCGDPALHLAGAILDAAGPGARVALVHATAYTDDRQVMVFLAERFQQRGLRTALTGPDHIRWRNDRACLEDASAVDFIFRFFPAEWLPNLPRRSRWQEFFRNSTVPICNPATALLTQSKRLPRLPLFGVG